MANYTLLASQMASAYVMYDERNDAINRDRIEREVLITYAMVSKSQWQRLVCAERKSRELDRIAAERLMANYKE